MGIIDVRVLNVEGIAFGPDAIEAAVSGAIAKAPALLKAA
jgi:FMN-dependent NADH-azoreductase